MSLDTKTFKAWLKVGRVFEAWNAYPNVPAVQSNLKPKSENEFVDSFEAFDAVERAITKIADDLLEQRGLKQLLKCAVRAGVLPPSEDVLIFKRDAVVREVARWW